MKPFDEAYHDLVNASVLNKLEEELEDPAKLAAYDKRHLDCLMNPERHAPVWRLEECQCPPEEKEACRQACFFGALSENAEGNIEVSQEKCVGCGGCIPRCKAEILSESKDIMPVLSLLSEAEAPVYALIAPAFISQFSDKVTPGKLRGAFKRLGFAGMLEVALFADILTLKEALEFDRSILDDHDFLLTSCCCPIWIAMIRKVYHLLVPHLPPSVSPMVACGRTVKKLNPGVKTVFIGPCVAKKAEAREEDVKDAVDYVLTFQEVQKIFEAAGVDPAGMEEDLRDHSSTAGRIYARVGGVSQAVSSTVERLKPGRAIPLTSRQANGVKECKELLNKIKAGEITANFLEGMGCVGGCVGGPKALIPKEEGTAHVNRYGGEAAYKTPVDNPYVVELLHSVGFESIDSLLEDGNMFVRKFQGN